MRLTVAEPEVAFPEHRRCRHPGCSAEGVCVVVGITPQQHGPNADPVDAITSLTLVCQGHNREPWIEVKRLDPWDGGGR